MSDQEVTYSALRSLQSPSESQTRLRTGGTKRPEETVDKECSVPWRLIAVTLGVLCLLLLMTAAVLGIKIFQCIREKTHDPNESLRNLSQCNHTIKNSSFLTDQKVESDIKKNRCHRKTGISSKFLPNTGKLDEEKWSCCGVTCYYFTTEDETWNRCEQTCQRSRSSLLKIDDEDEQVFIQSQAYKNIYWIGLSYDMKKKEWKWINSDISPGLNLKIMNLHSEREHCAFLTSTRITNTDCSKTYNCICEKTVNFLGSI